MTLTVVALVACVLLAVSAIVVNRLDAYFAEQEESALAARALEVGSIVAVVAVPASAGDPVIEAGNVLNTAVAERIECRFVPELPGERRGEGGRHGHHRRCHAERVRRRDRHRGTGRDAPGLTDHATGAGPDPRAHSHGDSSGRSRAARSRSRGAWRSMLSNPYTTRAYTLGDDHRAAGGHRARRPPRGARPGRPHREPLHAPAPAPQRGDAPPREPATWRAAFPSPRSARRTRR